MASLGFAVAHTVGVQHGQSGICCCLFVFSSLGEEMKWVTVCFSSFGFLAIQSSTAPHLSLAKGCSWFLQPLICSCPVSQDCPQLRLCPQTTFWGSFSCVSKGKQSPAHLLGMILRFALNLWISLGRNWYFPCALSLDFKFSLLFPNSLLLSTSLHNAWLDLFQRVLFFKVYL